MLIYPIEKLRLASSLAGLPQGIFPVRRLPLPDQAYLVDHTTRNPQALGGETRDGYIYVEVLWNRLLFFQAAVVRYFIERVEDIAGKPGNGTLYLTVPRSDAKHSGGVHFVDVSGIVIMPQWNPVQLSGGVAYDNVLLRLNNVTIENEPAA